MDMVHVSRDMLTLSLDMPKVSMDIATVSLDISSDTKYMARLSQEMIVSLNMVNVSICEVSLDNVKTSLDK
jgi:hypothetical protein